jgi:hypothetical protein
MTMNLMRVSTLCALALVGALTAACGDDTTTTTPITPPSPNVTDTFTGTLSRNGGTTHPFVVQSSGVVTAAITALTPDPTTQVGIALGIWTSVSACQIVTANDKASQGTTVLGTATGNGALCVRIYDSSGALPQDEAYQIDVSHP